MANPTIVLHPQQIHFTQNSVSDTFSDGTTIQERLDDLIHGRVFKWDIPMMKVVHRWGRWWSLNNRRLLVFKKFRNCGPIKAEIIPWREINKDLWERKFTTNNGGVFVRVRETVDPTSSSYCDSDDSDSECCVLQESAYSSDLDSEYEENYYFYI